MLLCTEDVIKQLPKDCKAVTKSRKSEQQSIVVSLLRNVWFSQIVLVGKFIYRKETQGTTV